MTKQIFITVLVTLSFFLGTNKVKAQLNVPSEVCGKYAELDYSGTIPTGATGYWIDSLSVVINWWQDINVITGNGPQTVAEVGQYGQNSFAFVIHDGASYDTSAWSTTTFLQKPQVDACPSCNLIENQDVNIDGNIVHFGHLRTDTVCLHDNNSFYLLNPSYSLGSPSWSKNNNGIDFANGLPPTYNISEELYDSVYTSVFNSEVGNAAGNFYILVFKSESGNGCSDSDTMLVSFAKQPSGEIDHRRPYCRGEEGLVWAQLDNEATPTEFNWNFGTNANVLDAVADATTPDSIYSVNWGTNDCNNLLHQVSLTASNDWGCTSSVNIVYVKEPGIVTPLFNNTNPSCSDGDGTIRFTSNTIATCGDTYGYTISSRWLSSTIPDFDVQIDYGAYNIIDSLYNVSSSDTSWLEVSHVSLITQEAGYIGLQMHCKDTIHIELMKTNIQAQQICLVLVDPITGKNKIVWEVNEIANNYIIQKALTSNNYSVIGTVNAGDPAEFIDYSSDPMAHSDFYKIIVQDTCGNISNIVGSMYHKTINLTLSNVGNTMSLNWNQYEVEDGSYVPSQYYIYRGTQPNNLQIIDSINGMLNSYNDINVSQLYYYMVGAKGNCIDNSKSTNIAYSILSNKKDNIDIIGINELSSNNPISIYPNPAHNNLQITINNEQLGTIIEILSTDGKILKQFKIQNSKFNIQISDLENGVYFVKLGNTVKKFIKE